MNFTIRHSIFVILLFAVFPNIGKAVEGFKLVCDEPVYDFGTVDQATSVTNVFMIRNEGDLTYVHKYVFISCGGCASGRLEKRMIGPGETVKLTAVYHTKNRKGAQKKALRLIAKNSTEPALVLYLKGVVDVAAQK